VEKQSSSEMMKQGSKKQYTPSDIKNSFITLFFSSFVSLHLHKVNDNLLSIPHISNAF